VSAGKNISNFYSLSDSDLINLLQTSPVAISISAYGWEYYRSGVFKCGDSSFLNVDHAVLLVGYTDSYWIVKNQWGSSWGMAGYILVTRTTSKNCLIGYSAHIINGAGDPTNDKLYIYNSGSNDSEVVDTTD
jgi:uncharacterized protein YvpB